MVKNPQVSAVSEYVHQVIGQVPCTAEIDTAKSVTPNDADVFPIHSTYHTVLEASPGAAIFGWDMLFDIPFVADWHKIGEHRQLLTDCSNQHKNNQCIDYN